MNTIFKRVISMVLCFVLVAGYLPVGALAQEMDTVQEPSADTAVVVEEEAAAEEESEDTSLTEDDENTSTVGDAEKKVSEESSADEEAETPSEGDEAAAEEDVTEGETVTEEPAAEEAEEETASIVEEVSLVAPLLDASGNVIDAAIFCSDVHGSSSAVSSAFNGIQNADSTFDPSTATFVGDTQMAASSVTSAAQSVYSDVACYYAYGNHDSEGNYGIEDVTGMLYNGDNYYIYAISQTSMASSNPDTSGFTSTVAGLDKSKPLFIASHLPLHDRRGDSNGAAAWYEAISAAAESMDIVFFWAHNHTGENDVDRAAFYVEKDGDETFTLENTSTVVTPNFTYMNAGFVGKSSSRGGVVTTVKIYDDAMVFQDYTSSGAFTGEYSHNVEVAREFAGSTDSGDGSTDEGGDTDGTTTTTTYNYTATAATDGTGYILVSNGYALQNNNGTIAAVAVTVSDDGSTVTFDSSVDVSTILWTIDSDGDVMNDGYYLLRASGSGTKSMTISTTDSGDAYSNWTYSSDTLTTTGGSGGSTTFYAYCSDGTFSTQSSSSQELKFYVPTSGTTSGGDSGSTDGDEDDTTTGGSTETVVGNGTYTTADDGSYQKVTFGTEGEEKTVYVLVSTPTAGKNYIIASDNSAGSAYALKENTTTGTSVTVNAATDSITAPYIENSDKTIVWTASSGMNFKSVNGSYYLNYSESKGSYSLSFSTGSASDWTAGTNTLYRKGSKNDYYLRNNNGTWTMGGKGTEYNVYFYEEQTINTSSSVTYSVTASDIEHFYTADTTDTETVTITKSVTNGTPDGTYKYEVVGGDSIITSIDQETGVITFNGAEGTAQVKVSYTWAAENDVNNDGVVDENDTYTIWQVINVTATSPYYTLDLHKATVSYTAVTGDFDSTATYFIKNEDGTYEKVEITAFENGVTYYTMSYTLGDEITAPIAIKGIEAGDQYGVWAVVKYYDGTTEAGTDMGAVGSDVEWSSSDETIATVDPVTGIITFTGKEGSVNITATYKNGNKPSDTITISVTQSQYSVPADGTNDFPEYPNEGAIRYDKTATAVGNFSETGIAQVELSMTGVPYTTGSEIDVVVMLDMTGSMTDDSMAAAEAAALAFANQIIKNTDDTYNNNRISVQVFNKNGVTELWAMSAVTADTYNTLVTAIESASTKQASGGTPYSTALSGCKDILDAARTDGTGNDRQQFCVFVSDGTPTSYTDVDGGSDTTKKEYYSNAMQEDGVTVYGVYTSAAAGTSGSNGGGSVNDTEEGTAIMQNVASSDDKVYVVEDYTDTSALTGVFTSIAKDILQAATNVTVEDQITDEYTMIFDLPEGSKDITGLDSQEFYIEFVKYTLDENHERTDTVTSITKLYLGSSNGTYYAASDASGTAYAAPVFAQTTIGDKGTLYYWTTDSGYATKAAVQYNDGTNTYYFIPYGIKATDDGYDSTKWFNMTSGAYANGTIDSTTNMSTDLVIATPYFVYNASTKMLYWTVDKLDTEEYALRYFLYLDNSATEVGTDKEVDAATYPTNDHAYITYTNFRGNGCQQKFPIPQLTWNGAQVSYVFYLVNSAGQPINKSGQVVDFANATFITDVYTKAVVWNKGVDGSTGTGELSADWLANELLPDEYTIYDELAGFTLNVYEKADGTTIKNQFTIEGDTAANISSSLNTRLDLETTASTVSTVTTKVYNTKAGQKVTGYGTYYSTDTNMAGIDFSNVTVAFAVVWESKLVPDAVVVDYGLDVLINVVQNDLMQNTVSGIGLGKDAYGTTAMNTGVIATAQLGTAPLTIDGNTISIENENAVRFHQGDMEFDEPVKFYYESPVKFYEDSEQKSGYMYSSVTVIPATTIYYEEDFLTLTSYTKGTDGTFEEDETSAWTTEGTQTNATQDQDRPGAAQISKDLDADNNYGYDSAYETMSTHSLNSSAKITVDANTRGEATFTFYGTGFDVISTTSNATGTITVKVTEVDDADGDGTANEVAKNTVVDTYYGYTQNTDGEWVTSVNNPNALYQVPVIKIAGLSYGQYSVKITAGYNEYFDNVEGSTSYDLYLDAIRIYDPTGNENETANNAYVQDGEAYPIYEELRDNIIAASEYKVTENEDGTVTVTGNDLSGAIFIDCNDAVTSIKDYVSYGPNNELYLANNQAIAFTIAVTETMADVQLGIKVANGGTVTYEINGDSYTIETATDMYYSIWEYVKGGGVVTIKNVSGGILSLTNIKATFSAASSTNGLLRMTAEDAGTALMMLRNAPEVDDEVPETTEPTETEPSVPETTDPEETEPETTESETEATEPEVTEPEEDTSDNVTADKVVETVKKFVKKLFGWIFG